MAQYIDNASFFRSVSQRWQDYVKGENIADQILAILQSCTCLPDPEIQWPLIAAFSLSNPKFARCLPALFLYGKPGSGKSSLGKVIAHFREAQIHSETTTYAGLRNYLHHAKYYNSDDDEGEPRERDGALLFLDNVYASTFESDKGMLFLAGYKRSDDAIDIAIPGQGRNMKFRTFSNRIFSSVDPIHTYYELRELSRRTVLVNCQPLTEFENDFDLESSIDPDSVHWEGFYSLYFNWWNSPKNILHLQECYRNNGKQVRRPSWLDAGRWEQIKDLTAVGIATGVWADWPKALIYWRIYFDWLSSRMAAKSQLEMLLESKIPADINAIPVSMINKWLSQWTEDSHFLERPKASAVTAAMLKLGFSQSKTEFIRA